LVFCLLLRRYISEALESLTIPLRDLSVLTFQLLARHINRIYAHGYVFQTPLQLGVSFAVALLQIWFLLAVAAFGRRYLVFVRRFVQQFGHFFDLSIHQKCNYLFVDKISYRKSMLLRQDYELLLQLCFFPAL